MPGPLTGGVRPFLGILLMRCPQCHQEVPSTVRWCSTCRLWLDDGREPFVLFPFMMTSLILYSERDVAYCTAVIVDFLRGEPWLDGFAGAVSDEGFRLGPTNSRLSGKPVISVQLKQEPTGTKLCVSVVPHYSSWLVIVVVLAAVAIASVSLRSSVLVVVGVVLAILAVPLVMFFKASATAAARRVLHEVVHATEQPPA